MWKAVLISDFQMKNILNLGEKLTDTFGNLQEEV